jgi:putative transposase
VPYWRLYYHLVWSTKNRQPILTPSIEPIVYDLLRSKALNLDAIVYAIGGIEDHVHMVVTISPKIAVATFIGQVKAVASTKFNKSVHLETSLYWQQEYAAFSFDEKRLPHYFAYVERQKEHHAAYRLIPILERTEPLEAVREVSLDYTAGHDTWWSELEPEAV